MVPIGFFGFGRIEKGILVGQFLAFCPNNNSPRDHPCYYCCGPRGGLGWRSDRDHTKLPSCPSFFCFQKMASKEAETPDAEPHVILSNDRWNGSNRTRVHTRESQPSAARIMCHTHSDHSEPRTPSPVRVRPCAPRLHPLHSHLPHRRHTHNAAHRCMLATVAPWPSAGIRAGKSSPARSVVRAGGSDGRLEKWKS